LTSSFFGLATCVPYEMMVVCKARFVQILENMTQA
jgi:hypothetical protein